MKNLFILLITFITITSCKAQLPPGEYTTTNKKAISLFQDALKEYQAGKDADAENDLLKAIEKDPNFIEPHLLLAEMYQVKKQVQKAIDSLERAGSVVGAEEGRARRVRLNPWYPYREELATLLSRIGADDFPLQDRLAEHRRRPRRSGKNL